MADFSNSTVVPIRPAQVHLKALAHRPSHAELFDRLTTKAIAARAEHELLLCRLQSAAERPALGELQVSFERRLRAAELLATLPSASTDEHRRKRFAIGGAWLRSGSNTFLLIQGLLANEAARFAPRAQRRA